MEKERSLYLFAYLIEGSYNASVWFILVCYTNSTTLLPSFIYLGSLLSIRIVATAAMAVLDNKMVSDLRGHPSIYLPYALDATVVADLQPVIMQELGGIKDRSVRCIRRAFHHAGCPTGLKNRHHAAPARHPGAVLSITYSAYYRLQHLTQGTEA